MLLRLCFLFRTRRMFPCGWGWGRMGSASVPVVTGMNPIVYVASADGHVNTFFPRQCTSHSLSPPSPPSTSPLPVSSPPLPSLSPLPLSPPSPFPLSLLLPKHLQRYQWLQLQNIYYRDRKFSMEVYQSTK